MPRESGSFREMRERSVAIEKGLEKHFTRFSRWLWPWRETKLVFVIVCLAVLDFASTYAFLRLSVSDSVYESGPMANWALENGGFIGLFIADILAVTVISAVAFGVRSLLSRFGYDGYGRTAFVLMLVPYMVVTLPVIFNNVVITFL